MALEWIDFLKENYFLAIYGLTLIVSIISYRKYFDTELKYFPILIAYTFLNELLGYFIRYNENFSFFTKYEYINHNDLIYNIYEIVFFGFFFFVFWQLVKKNKNQVKIVSLVALLSYIFNAFFQDPTHVILYYASAVASWILVYCAILYLIELKKQWDWNTQKHNLMFWVSMGLILFHVFFPILSLTGFLNLDLWQQLHLRTVLRVLIIVMYSLFIIGFVKARRKVAF